MKLAFMTLCFLRVFSLPMSDLLSSVWLRYVANWFEFVDLWNCKWDPWGFAKWMEGKLQAFHLFLHGYSPQSSFSWGMLKKRATLCRSRRLRYCRVWSTSGSGEVLDASSFTPSRGKVVSATQPVTNKSHWGNYSGSLKQLPNPNFLISQKTLLR